MRTGVFFCQAEDNRNLNIDSIAKYSANLPEVETVQILRLKPLPEVKFISEQIKSNNLERIVLAGDMPGYFKPVFTKTVDLTGGNTAEIRLASFQDIGEKGETERHRANDCVVAPHWGIG